MAFACLNWRESTTRGGCCGSIGLNAGNLTRKDGRMKLRLKTLANKPRSVAWPASARAVRCQVKSCNERDLRQQLLPSKKFGGHSVETACVSRRKEEATLGQYGLNFLGHTWHTMAGTMRSDAERRRQSPKPCPSPDWGLKLVPMKLESLVIACHQSPQPFFRNGKQPAEDFLYTNLVGCLGSGLARILCKSHQLE